ncbi:MAG: efflux RND transporter periplasmic adaptor subunit [Alphaproteobacteria bacterium]|nr:efflux RND transporter periplasmic adaptor subunit [Alphaproteobacteria bacterium]MBU1514726.1 efflux RND transporter periplasmic adaptor subunit [Alphaproteobacteria bacterium]MBU2093857.1 efflux RND transporter periplasmic adaptor subunit [Alphaproteobacteria bacterium]MBU2150906.1 efflux RND transporter periplasmic adaptor subunit [Alphaproteobacteria bacterium]MBU2309712.1 efflux RND transporter periplasmic adaptor subunit [Alphaproteobacteria bacterium]
MIRRHFFLVAALVVLAVMIVAGGFKVLSKTSAGAGAGGQAAQGQGAGGPQAKGGARRGAFGGPTLVSVTTVQPRVFEDTIEVLGVAKGRQSVTLTAATTQLVDRVLFKDGQRVARGALLVQLKDTEQDAGAAQAQARLVEARKAYDRYKTLGDQGWTSKAQVEQFEAAWRSAQADVAAAKARQGDRTIRAPFAGVVGLSDVAPGALVNPGAPIVTLDDVSVMRVDFQVPERYLGQLREGQTLLATADAYPGETISGRIAQLDTRVDERTRAITARAEFPNGAGKLKPGMLVRVGVSRGQRTNPSAPESAISVQGDGAFVYILHSRPAGQAKGQAQAKGQGAQGGAMVEQRPIVTGLRQRGFVEITDGVKLGDKIVSDGLNKIQPGQPVRVAGGQRPGAAGGAEIKTANPNPSAGARATGARPAA